MLLSSHPEAPPRAVRDAKEAGGVSAAETPAAGASTALVVFDRLNADRVASGLRPLRWNAVGRGADGRVWATPDFGGPHR